MGVPGSRLGTATALDLDIDKMLDRLEDDVDQGALGTGKDACIRYLAESLSLEIMQRQASDLMSMWTSETE